MRRQRIPAPDERGRTNRLHRARRKLAHQQRRRVLHLLLLGNCGVLIRRNPNSPRIRGGIIPADPRGVGILHRGTASALRGRSLALLLTPAPAADGRLAPAAADRMLARPRAAATGALKNRRFGDLPTSSRETRHGRRQRNIMIPIKSPAGPPTAPAGRAPRATEGRFPRRFPVLLTEGRLLFLGQSTHLVGTEDLVQIGGTARRTCWEDGSATLTPIGHHDSNPGIKTSSKTSQLSDVAVQLFHRKMIHEVVVRLRSPSVNC